MRQVWEVFAKEKLSKYRAKKAALTTLPEEIAQLESAYTSIRCASMDSQPRKGGGSKPEDVMMNNISMRQELRKNLEEAARWVKTVESAMAFLSEEERAILDKFYIHPVKNNVSVLCEELGYEKSTVYRKHDTALYHFTLALYGKAES